MGLMKSTIAFSAAAVQDAANARRAIMDTTLVFIVFRFPVFAIQDLNFKKRIIAHLSFLKHSNFRPPFVVEFSFFWNVAASQMPYFVIF